MSTISKIAPLWGTMPQRANELETKEAVPTRSFFDIFKDMAQAAKEAQEKVNQTDYLLSTGQLENPAASSIAIAEAELSVQMLSQLRTKALDAYSELIRISM